MRVVHPTKNCVVGPSPPHTLGPTRKAVSGAMESDREEPSHLDRNGTSLCMAEIMMGITMALMVLMLATLGGLDWS